MSPRVKRSRAELPQTRIRTGILGALPIQDWSLSVLYHGRCECLVGLRDAEETLRLKANSSSRCLQDGKKSLPLMLEGRVFNGCSDALYRGQLPEVLLTCLSEHNKSDFLNNIADYLEQLVGLGFLGAQNQEPTAELVSLHFPNFVLLGPGVWFSQVMLALAGFLKDLERPFPFLTSERQAAILGRFLRGSVPPEFEISTGNEFRLIPLPDKLRVAGGMPAAQKRVLSVLAQYGWSADVENATRNAAERLELQDTAWRLSGRVIPVLTSQKRLSATEAKKLSPLVQQAILKIGHRREAFRQSETKLAELSSKSGGPMNVLSPTAWATERKTLLDLSAYATALDLPQEKQILEQLAATLPADAQ